MLGVGLALVGAALGLLRPKAPARTLPWSARAAIAFAALTALSFAWGLPSGAADLATFGAAFGVAAWARRLGPAGAMRASRLAALALGGIVAFVALARAAGGARGFALHAGQGNPNWLGLLLAITVPLSIDALASRHSARRSRLSRHTARALVALSTAAQLVALALSHSRVAWIATAVAGAVALAFAVRRARARVPLALGAVVLFASLAMAQGARGDVPVSRALRGRASIWSSSLSAATAALPLGAGLGSFGRVFLDAQGRALQSLTPNAAARRFVNATTAHQEYLQVAAESGPLAFAALVLAFALAVYGHLRARWIGGGAALVACSVTCLGDSPLRQPAVALLLGLLLGALRGTPQNARARSPRARRRAASLASLLVAGWLLLVSTRAWLSTRARAQASSLAPKEELAALARSVRVDPTSGEAQLALGLAQLVRGNAAAALPALDRARVLLADVGLLVAIGHAHLALGDAPAAAAAYRAALLWSPGSLRAHAGLAEALRKEGLLKPAAAEITIARKLSPGNAQVRELEQRIREERMDE